VLAHCKRQSRKIVHVQMMHARGIQLADAGEPSSKSGYLQSAHRKGCARGRPATTTACRPRESPSLALGRSQLPIRRVQAGCG